MLKRFTSHTLMALAEASLVALLVVGLVAGTAFAAKGGGGGKPSAGGGTIALVVLGEDGVANYGDEVTFAVSTTATSRPFVALNCYQGGVWIYSGSAGFFPDYPWSQVFILRNSSWTAGAADCTARLYATKDGTRTTTLATMSFYVAP